MRVVVQRAVMTGVTVAAVAVVTSAGFGSQVMPQIVPVRNYVPSIKAVGVRTGSEADLLEIAHASAVPIPVPVEIQYTEIKGQSRAGVTRMNMNYKIGVVSLLIIGIATLITSLTTSGIFTRIGTIGIVGLSVFGIYAFKGDSGSRKGRS